MNKLEFRMDIPAVTREYTPGSCHNSRKPMRLSNPCEMTPDSPALCPEQLRFPNQMAALSSLLAWRVLWTEEPGGLQSMGSQRAGHNWSDLAQHSCNKCMTQSSHLALLLFTLLHSWSTEDVCFRHRIITGPFIKAVWTTCTWIEMSNNWLCVWDRPNPGIEPRSPTLQADFLPAEPQGKPKNTGVGSLSLLQEIFPTQESNWDLLIIGRFLTNRAIREAHITP